MRWHAMEKICVEDEQHEVYCSNKLACDGAVELFGERRLLQNICKPRMSVYSRPELCHQQLRG